LTYWKENDSAGGGILVLVLGPITVREGRIDHNGNF